MKAHDESERIDALLSKAIERARLNPSDANVTAMLTLSSAFTAEVDRLCDKGDNQWPS